MRPVHAFLVLIALLSASAASATSVNLRWVGGQASSGSITGLGTDSVFFSPSSVATLTLDIRVAVDAAGLRSAFLSLEFDRDLMNELDIVSFQEISWTAMMMNTQATPQLTPFSPGVSTQESTGSQIGKLYTFDLSTASTASDCCPVSTTLAFGRVVFTTHHFVPLDENADIFSGLFNAGVDAIVDQAGNDISGTTIFGTARVGIPEPSTLGLLGLGLGALVLAGRGRPKP